MVDKMLIFDLNLDFGGVQRQILNLMNYWPDKKSPFVLVLMERQGVFFSRIPKNVRVITLSEKMPNNNLLKLIWYLIVMIRFLKFLRKETVEVILTFIWLPTFLVVIARHLTRKKITHIWSVHSDLDYDFENKFLSPVRKFIVQKILLKNPDFFVTVSNGMVYKLIALQAPSDKISLIRNSIDFDELNNVKDKSYEIIQKKFPIRIISAGRLVRQKGFDVLLEAFIKIRDLPIELVILGDGPLKKSLQEKIIRFDLQDRIILPGFQQNIYNWFKNADIFVSTSRWDPCAVAMLEAMAVGLPIVATKTDGAQYLLVDGKNGFIVQIDNTDDIAGKLRELILNQRLREKVGQENISRSLSFEANKHTLEYYKLVQKLCA